MARHKVSPEDLRKIRPVSASDKEWQEFTEAASRAGHQVAPLLRELMRAFVSGKFNPYPRSE